MNPKLKFVADYDDQRTPLQRISKIGQSSQMSPPMLLFHGRQLGSDLTGLTLRSSCQPVSSL